MSAISQLLQTDAPDIGQIANLFFAKSMPGYVEQQFVQLVQSE